MQTDFNKWYKKDLVASYIIDVISFSTIFA